MLLAVLAGMVFGIYLVPLKLSKLSSQEFLLSMTLGIFLSTFMIWLLLGRKVQQDIVLPGILSGIIWNAANFSSFYAILNLGLAIGFPLTQTSLFVSILWGLIYFREIKERSHILKVLIGGAILFLGAFLLIISL